jgi:hypothetical protein
MLPLLNWTAARASDVVVQVLREWKMTIDEAVDRKLTEPVLYCNTRHVHVKRAPVTGLRIEWVGEHRDVRDGTTLKTGPAAVGRSEKFDLVVLAIGFGPERERALSYWRNETLAQPSLEPARMTYLVSGQGDGAMIDVLRLRISQFRQDRILSELFEGADTFLAKFRELHASYASSSSNSGIFDAFERLELDNKAEFDRVRDSLARRLRRDTDVVLRLRVETFSQLFESEKVRISFQNRLLIYLLYKCGGFYPTHEEHDETLQRKYGIADDRVIRRHGPQPKEHIQTVLSEELYQLIVRNGADPSTLQRQSDDSFWAGGYFGFPGPSDLVTTLPDYLRAWRKEYLPGPTELLGTAFCSGLAGMFAERHPSDQRLRVTLHRVAVFGADPMLQQICDYVGTPDSADTASAAGRTFPVRNATIGLAYMHQRIVRSVASVDPMSLNKTMEGLKLNDASRKMSTSVGFVLAIPVLAPGSHGSRVIAVVYVDSTAPSFYIGDDELRLVVLMTTTLFRSLTEQRALERITNIPSSENIDAVTPEPLSPEAASTLEFVKSIEPPALNVQFDLNFDYSDFVPV